MVCAMKKAGVLSILLLAVLLAVAAEAPQPTKVPPIGYLEASDPVFESPCRRIRLALRELGYVEGQNTAIE